MLLLCCSLETSLYYSLVSIPSHATAGIALLVYASCVINTSTGYRGFAPSSIRNRPSYKRYIAFEYIAMLKASLRPTRVVVPSLTL